MQRIPGNWKVEKTFKSKKNTVLKIKYEEKYYVVKKYSADFIDWMEIERGLLKKCCREGVSAPEILDSESNILLLQYIPGKSAKELFDLDGDKKDILSDIADWLSRFHKIIGERRGDSILSNFIIADDGVYGIDFEEGGEEDILRDVGDLCASVLRMKPAFTENKFALVEFFLNEYFSRSSQPRLDMTDPIVESLNHYSKYGSDGEIVREWAEKIKEEGLGNISGN